MFKLSKWDKIAILIGILIGCLVTISSAFGQDITISGPDKIETGQYYRYDVAGLPKDKLASAKLEYTPTDGVVIFPVQSWGGDPFLFVTASKKCQLTITISLNSWRFSLQKAIEDAAQAKVDDALVLDLRLIDDEANAQYPFAKGSMSIQVGDGDPPPPPPPDPTEGPWKIVIFYDSDQIDDYTQDQRELIRSRTEQDEIIAAGHQIIRIIDKQSLDGGVPESLKPYVESVLNDPLPRIAITPITGNGPVTDFPLPEDLPKLMELLKKGGI